MDVSLLLEYGLLLLALIALEGVLSADNALVLAVMVKKLPELDRKKALFYGLFGALFLRITALFLISFLARVWQMQALGALYLLFISFQHLFFNKREPEKTDTANGLPADAALPRHASRREFWLTVVKVEFADIAFAVDSILAAVALAITLSPTGWGTIGGLDTGQFLVIFAGGFIGLVIMRFAATLFVKLLEKRPSLEKAAFVIVGWVGVKLAITTLAHPSLGVIPEAFPHSTAWKFIFFGVMIAIALWGWFGGKARTSIEQEETIETETKKKTTAVPRTETSTE